MRMRFNNEKLPDLTKKETRFLVQETHKIFNKMLQTTHTQNNQMAERVVQPTDADVLCGSGSTKAVHPGNQRFRRIVSKHYSAYASALSKTEKMKVSRQIMREVISNGGRFLKKDTGSHDWYIADIKVGKDKTSHCLRGIKNKSKKNRSDWMVYQQGCFPPPPPDATTSSMHSTSATPGKLLYASQDTRQCWGSERAANAPSVSPMTMPLTRVISANLQYQQRAAATGSHEYYEPSMGETLDLSPELLNAIPSSKVPAWNYSTGCWETQPETAPPAQHSLLVDFANTFGEQQPQDQLPADYCYPNVSEESTDQRTSEVEGSWSTNEPHQQDERNSTHQQQQQQQEQQSYCQPPTTYSKWSPANADQRATTTHSDQPSLPSSAVSCCSSSRWTRNPLDNDETLSNIFSDVGPPSPRSQQL